MTTEQRERAHRRLASIIGGFTVALLIGGFPARQAAARLCAGGEQVEMNEPVVVLIDGPGDLLEEQMWWSESDVVLHEHGRLLVTADGVITGYGLTRTP